MFHANGPDKLCNGHFNEILTDVPISHPLTEFNGFLTDVRFRQLIPFLFVFTKKNHNFFFILTKIESCRLKSRLISVKTSVTQLLRGARIQRTVHRVKYSSKIFVGTRCTDKSSLRVFADKHNLLGSNIKYRIYAWRHEKCNMASPAEGF